MTMGATTQTGSPETESEEESPEKQTLKERFQRAGETLHQKDKDIDAWLREKMGKNVHLLASAVALQCSGPVGRAFVIASGAKDVWESLTDKELGAFERFGRRFKGTVKATLGIMGGQGLVPYLDNALPTVKHPPTPEMKPMGGK